MTKPLVSVVFRAFNCEQYIGQAIESVLAQSFQDFEIVVVDDASPDGTDAVLHAYAQQDERLRIFRHETRQGPVRTMNDVLQHARGELIAVHDSDDVSLPRRLETEVSFLRANPQIALIGSGAYVIDEEGEEVKVINWGPQGPKEVRLHLEKGYSFIHSSVMFRRECIEAIGFYDEFFACAHDYDMLVRMAEKYDVVYYKEPLVKWRWLTSGITGSKKRAQAAFVELSKARSKAKTEGISLDLQQEYNRLISRGAIKSGIQRNQPLSHAAYYYRIGLLLLGKGKLKKARKRFSQALRHKGEFKIRLRAFILYILSFCPKFISTSFLQALQKAILGFGTASENELSL